MARFACRPIPPRPEGRGFSGFPGESVRDMRGFEAAPELPEAAARLGLAVMAEPKGRPGDPQKVNVLGGDPPTIRAWLAWAEAQGLIDLYGDPARGFAGGYRRG